MWSAPWLTALSNYGIIDALTRKLQLTLFLSHEPGSGKRSIQKLFLGGY